MESPDSFHLSAAQGWLGLDDPSSALAELEQISPGNQEHPGVLLLRYEIYSEGKDWNMAAVVAECLTRALPDDSDVWIFFAYSTRRKAGGGVLKAKEILLSTEPRFPGEYLFPFNLACYCSQLHEYAETDMWLKKAFRLKRNKVKRMATADEDFKPFWKSAIGTAWTWG